MVSCAFALTLLGTVYELLHHRVNIVVIAIGAVLLALFGLAAWAVSATIPLDVALDAGGITFAGARTAWSAISGATLEQVGSRAHVSLQTPEGGVRIGPTDPANASAILASIRAVKT